MIETIKARSTAFLAAILQKLPIGGRIFYTPRDETGVVVSEQNALTFSAVWGCVQVITRSLAPLPWRVHRAVGAADAAVAESNPIDYLLHCRPNDEMGAYTFRELLLIDALLWGNGFAEIQRDGGDRPVALWPIPAESFLGLQRSGDGSIEYRFHGATAPLAARDVFHLRGPGDPNLGYSVVRLAARTIGLGLAQERFAATFFGNGARPSFTVEVPGAMTPEKRTNFEDAIAAGHGGKNANRPMVLTHGAKASPLTMPLEDAQFLDSRVFQVREVARWFGVPPHKLGDLADATFSNVEQMEQSFNLDALTPWAARLEQEANYKLLGGTQRSRALWTRINLTARLRGDTATRAAFYGQMFQMGVFSTNDIRRLEELPGVGSDGDKRLVQTNLTTLELVGETPDPAPASPPPQSPDAPQEPTDPADAPMDTAQAAAAQLAADARAAARVVCEEAAERIARREAARLADAAKRAGDDAQAFGLSVGKFAAEHQTYIASAAGRAMYAASLVMAREWDPAVALRLAEREIAAVNAADLHAWTKEGVRREQITEALMKTVEALPRRNREAA